VATRSIWILGALGGAALVGIAGWVGASWIDGGVASASPESEGRSRVPVQVADVEQGAFEVTHTLTGTLEPAATFQVAAKVGGRVDAVLVDLADVVQRGDVLIELDDAELRQAVAAARAELSVARAQLESARASRDIAKQAFDRVRTLANKNIAAKEELDRARADHLEAQAGISVAQARVKQQSAALEAARVRASYAQVRATWAGEDGSRVVASRLVDEGEMVAPNDPLLRIVDLDPVIAVVFATEQDYALLAPGQAVTITTDARPGEDFEGHVLRVAPVFDRDSRQARVELEIDNPNAKLRPGMFIRATTTTQRMDDVTTVPRDALVERNGQAAVFIVSGDASTVTLVPVQLGPRSASRVVVTGQGLTGSVVVLGQNMLEDGAPISIVGESGEGEAA